MDLSPVIISMRTAAVSILITLFLGIGVGAAVFSIRNEKIKAILDGIFTLPMVLPPTVVGFLLLYLFGVQRPIGKFLIHFLGIKIVFTWWATVLAAVVITFPLMYRSAIGAFEQVDRNIIYAARTLGLSEWKIFWRILLPNAKPGILSGTILAFARGLGEFGATIMLAGNIAGKTRTLPMAVYSAVAAGDMELAYGYVGILVVTSFAIVIGMNLVSKRKDIKKQ
jgi:molybdate transport system permease protein